MKLKFASYNIHKAVGLDRQRDPDRILTVLNEIDADIIALQECDRRFGMRETVLPRARIEDSPFRTVPLATRSMSIGWHGNTFLVKKNTHVLEAQTIALPTLEPRGAIRLDVELGGQRVRAVGMHLDLSGLRRRHQAEAILRHLDDCEDCPTVMMGDTNEWSGNGGVFRVFRPGWTVLESGRSFPASRPLAQLDRIVLSSHWTCHGTNVHHSMLAARASDHLPVWAEVSVGSKAFVS
ncbi:endonuclease/exonuclease/phosphatase family protein [Croceicoccus sp. F390]|uniref:Endonuclease/exonuclease/phosphatase family protein n=1 Tax=Croceicoccus esteveae TaxID=3075597 RepID=A0ABU2ZJH7_9SPHN|nr:endonuclease/exonuclease/phosphatase family protein [Croceicoccus sp. F390]MDT0576760.1 endonuclease/exonuclease/phosphatase family protein [Croceicoccus sp. F390]